MIGALETPIPGWLDVSRETQARLTAFYALVLKWNASINLVSAASLTDGWNRHVLDSAQLVEAAGQVDGKWLDIGSGGGFPGLVVAIVLAEVNPQVQLSLVESDRRKATFLSEANRILNLGVEVICARIENLPAMQADIVSARAFAPLAKLLSDAVPHLKPNGIGLFPKGKMFRQEIEDAHKFWNFECDDIQSKTDDAAVILRVREVRHVGS